MNLRNREERLAHLKEAIICITAGTLAGLAVYQFFLYFNIAIFGWNLGLIFAPMIAGTIETLVAQKIIGEDTDNKVHKLLDFADGGNIADPWYTGNFDITYKDVVNGCRELLKHIKNQ